MFCHIHFAVGLKKDFPCWLEGFLNSGSVGSLKKMTLKIDNKENITIFNYSLEDGKNYTTNEKLERYAFIEKYADILKTDVAAFSEVLQMSVFHETAEENLSDEGTLLMRRGKDYSGEINVVDLPKITAKLMKNLRVVFMECEKTNNSGKFIDEQELAAVFIPIF
jgi:hypothetical protein